MKNDKGNVHAENNSGTHDKEYELNKRLSKHNIDTEKHHLLKEVQESDPEVGKMKGVNSENVGGTTED